MADDPDNPDNPLTVALTVNVDVPKEVWGDVAEFFRQTEPHSPVAYLVQRASNWGEMPLEDWLAEVIKSKEVLSSVRETLGIKDAKPQQ